METHVNYTLAGIFVLTLSAVIVLGVIWLSTGFSREDYAYYNVFMNEPVSGLKIDGAVEFNGVDVGTVYKIRINKVDPQLVELLLRINANTPVTFGTRAKLGIRMLSGVAYILLEDKGDDTRPLVALSGKPYPVILTSPSILVRLDTMMTQMSVSLQHVSASIQALLDKRNLNNIRQILYSGQGAMRQFEIDTLPAATRAVGQFGVLTENLNALSAEIRENPAVLIRGKTPPQPGPGEK